MVKLVLALTPEALNKAISENYMYNTAVGRLMQHKVLFSDIIKDEYERYFRENDNLMFYQQWVKHWAQWDYLEYRNSLEEDFKSEIVSQMKQFPFHIVICEKGFNVDRDSVQELKLDDINDRFKQNILSIYCVPVNRQIRKGTSIDEIREWLSNLLQGEENITIIDRYILKDADSCKLLKQYYIPMMSSAKKITIIYDGAKTDQNSVITPLKKQYKERIILKGSDPKDFHDRSICCKYLTIQFEAGLDFVDIRTGKTRVETTIVVDPSIKPTLPASYRR